MEKQGANDQTCVLKVNIQCCKACPKKLKKTLLKQQGVYSVVIDEEKGQVKVGGRIQPSVLIKTIEQSSRKFVELVSFDKNFKDDLITQHKGNPNFTPSKEHIKIPQIVSQHKENPCFAPSKEHIKIPHISTQHKGNPSFAPSKETIEFPHVYKKKPTIEKDGIVLDHSEDDFTADNKDDNNDKFHHNHPVLKPNKNHHLRPSSPKHVHSVEIEKHEQNQSIAPPYGGNYGDFMKPLSQFQAPRPYGDQLGNYGDHPSQFMKTPSQFQGPRPYSNYGDLMKPLSQFQQPPQLPSGLVLQLRRRPPPPMPHSYDNYWVSQPQELPPYYHLPNLPPSENRPHQFLSDENTNSCNIM